MGLILPPFPPMKPVSPRQCLVRVLSVFLSVRVRIPSVCVNKKNRIVKISSGESSFKIFIRFRESVDLNPGSYHVSGGSERTTFTSKILPELVMKRWS